VNGLYVAPVVTTQGHKWEARRLVWVRLSFSFCFRFFSHFSFHFDSNLLAVRSCSKSGPIFVMVPDSNF
jgi:hypothetical protein